MAKTDFAVDKENLEVRITRVFDATPERMWQAHTQADQIVQWWTNTRVDKLELRVGGAWRFVSDGQDGKEQACRGEFKVLDKPHKLVRTFELESYPGHGVTESMVLEPLEGGKTKQTTISKYHNLGDLEGMVSGMERGAPAGLDRLAKVVEPV